MQIKAIGRSDHARILANRRVILIVLVVSDIGGAVAAACIDCYAQALAVVAGDAYVPVVKIEVLQTLTCDRARAGNGAGKPGADVDLVKMAVDVVYRCNAALF